MNQAAMRITASLLLWYLLSTMSIERRGWSTKGLGPLTHPPLILSASGCYHHVDISLPVKYYHLACLHASALSTRPNSSPVSLVDAKACLLCILCVCLSLCLPLRSSICFIELLIALPTSTRRTAIAPLFTVSALVVFCKAAGSGEPMRKP